MDANWGGCGDGDADDSDREGDKIFKNEDHEDFDL